MIQKSANNRPRSVWWLAGAIFTLGIGVAAFAGFNLNARLVDNPQIPATQGTAEILSFNNEITELTKMIRNLQDQVEELGVARTQPVIESTPNLTLIEELRYELDEIRRENSEILQYINGLETGMADSIDDDSEPVAEEIVWEIEEQFGIEENVRTEWGGQVQQSISTMMLSNPKLGDLVVAECRGKSCRTETIHDDTRQFMQFSSEISEQIDPTGEGLRAEFHETKEPDGRIRITSYYQLDHSNPAVQE